ncbi:MAG: hypothetical protein SFW66_07230 [Gammaproteobacteria bacterium]|nr:hypothetical protein [Gammaproteobacteria bacterium]
MPDEDKRSYLNTLGRLISKNTAMFSFGMILRASLAAAFASKTETSNNRARIDFIKGETATDKSVVNRPDSSFKTIIGARVLNVFAWPFVLVRAMNSAITLGIDKIGTQLFGIDGFQDPNLIMKSAKIFFTWILPPIAEVEMVTYGLKKLSDVVIDGVAALGKKIFSKKETQQTPAADDRSAGAVVNKSQKTVRTSSDNVVTKRLSESQSSNVKSNQKIETPVVQTQSMLLKIFSTVLTGLSTSSTRRSKSVSVAEEEKLESLERPRRNTMR